MALVSKMKAVRQEIPHEDGEWMDFKPLSLRQVNALQDAENVEAANRALAAGIVAWSYAEAVTVEDIDDLDLRTWMWAAEELRKLSGIETRVDENGESEGEGGADSSSEPISTTEPATPQS